MVVSVSSPFDGIGLITTETPSRFRQCLQIWSSRRYDDPDVPPSEGSDRGRREGPRGKILPSETIIRTGRDRAGHKNGTLNVQLSLESDRGISAALREPPYAATTINGHFESNLFEALADWDMHLSLAEL